MFNSLIQGIFNFIPNLIDLFIEPFINALSNIPGLTHLNDFIVGCVRLFGYVADGGIFVQRFLMIPDGLMVTIFYFLGSLTGMWLVLKTSQFILRVYNLVKGPI